MLPKIALIGFVSLVLASCDSPSKSTSESATNEEDGALRGLQSLTRVQLKLTPGGFGVAADAEDLEDYAREQLHEQLPQLNVDGSGNDWLLEVELGATYYYDLRVSTGAPTATPTCRCRVSKTAVVDGRLTTAVVFDVTVPGSQFLSRDESRRAVLRFAIQALARTWRRDNSIPETQPQSVLHK